MSNMENLPPEMRQRLAQIMATAQTKPQAQPQEPEPTAPPAPQRPPTLMDHLLALRQEVESLRIEVSSARQEQRAANQVVDAVGQAVGQMYAMLNQQTQATQDAATYSQQFQQQPPSTNDDSDF